ncbi:YecA family protein [Psychrobacter sp. FDAARGOS_221]|uniref:YecA/YgfB family protein n=1 Tax=Psychrobacter sp. FDAARGOS_221 TaxID=1975705 RepID=UPI000BB55180|nr:YecA family protein [Psychrobacter sp. FDAARGOS_221]PNK60960.1 YecA family protein [Psychrobacter sp. FDAARGOS_221]
MTLDELLHFLDSDANEFGLDSVATHGFLTATVVGKPLPNWLSHLFEGQDSKVDKDVKQAIKDWREALLEDLQSEEGIALPLEVDDESGEMDFSPESELTAWSIGFVDAMYGDENVDWFSDDEISEDVAMLTLPMMVFSGIDAVDGEEDEDLAAIRQDDDALAQMANSIEANLSELFLLFNTDE